MYIANLEANEHRVYLANSMKRKGYMDTFTYFNYSLSLLSATSGSHLPSGVGVGA